MIRFFIITIIWGTLTMAAVRPGQRFSVITNAVDHLPLEVIASEFLAARAIGSVNTSRNYANDLRHFADFMAEKLGVPAKAVMFHDVNRIAIEAFRDARLKVESRATVARRCDCLRALCSYVEDRYKASNRSVGVSRVYPQRKRFVGMSREQLESLLSVAELAPIQKGYVVALLAHTGMRNTDARNILLGDISDDFRFFTFLSKGAKIRTVPVSDTLRRWTFNYLNWRYEFPTLPNWPLLVSSRAAFSKKPLFMNAKTVWRIVNDLALSAGIPIELCHPHRLRHTFAYVALDHMLNEQKMGFREALITLRDILGHSDIETTMRYLQISEDTAYDAVRTLGAQRA